MPNPLLSIPQKNLLRHLADNAQGVDCSGDARRRPRTLGVLVDKGLAEVVHYRLGRPTKAGLALVKSWRACT